MLHASGLTEVLLTPESDIQLWRFGIGLTDVSKTGRGMDANITAAEREPERLVSLAVVLGPAVVAFNGKTAARAVARHLGVSGRSKLHYGDQGVWSGLGRVFILPSSSAANARLNFAAKLSYWLQLAGELSSIGANPTWIGPTRSRDDGDSMAAR